MELLVARGKLGVILFTFCMNYLVAVEGFLKLGVADKMSHSW